MTETNPNMLLPSSNQVQAGKNQNKPLLLTPSCTTALPYTTLPVRRITTAERRDRLAKGLCFNCDAKYVRGHQFENKIFVLMVNKDDDSPDVGDNSNDMSNDGITEERDVSILNLLVIHGSPHSL